jgi:ribosomal protein S18 acetylase RimI-like enzyme
VPPTFDRDLLRPILNRDRAWAVYPLGDLDDRRFHLCDFRTDISGNAFLLLYRISEIPVLVVGGCLSDAALLLDECGPPPAVDLHVPTEFVPHLKQRYSRVTTRVLLRMRLGAPRLMPHDDTELLTREDVPALKRLYADGDAASEAPDFFFPEMLDDESFFGIREEGELVAVAGTHLVAPSEGTAAIGNVYTRRDRRGRGLGARTTSAAVESLLARGIATVALSVIASNTTAVRLYERLGFVEHCTFVDGLASERVIS